MNEYKWKKSHLEKKIIDFKAELDELRNDLMVVSSQRVKDFITDRMKQLERRIEMNKFKLWNMEK